MSDIYFEQGYGKLYENHEGGTCEIFEFNNAVGSVYHMFIKRLIPITVNGSPYYDIVTPYGYGGPLIKECKKGFEDKLVNEFMKQFESYCNDNNIVSEFIRYHPVIGNVKEFKNYYNVTYIRNTVGTNLAEFEDPVQAEFSKSCRKDVRRALKKGVSYKVLEKPKDVSEFQKFYYSTMKRNKASEYYYFDEEYFNRCVEQFSDHLLLVQAIYEEQPIAMGFYFIYDRTIHMHLSGTLSEFLHLSPAYILKYGVTLWGKEKGYELIHHGGGRTNDPEDSLYKFKKQFGKNTEFMFYVGKKIWNTDIYRQLCQMKNVEEDMEFFPAYRYNKAVLMKN